MNEHLDNIENLVKHIPSQYNRYIVRINNNIEIKYTRKIGERWELFDALCINLETSNLRIHKDSTFVLENLK